MAKKDDSVKNEIDCWNFPGSKLPSGYGMLWDKEKKQKVYAHRYFYEMFVGPIPDGTLVCHHCDNPACINPKHLFLGSYKDNMQDAKKKGRLHFCNGEWHPTGEKNGRARLTLEQVKVIRERYISGSRGSSPSNASILADEYGVSKSAIVQAAKGEHWG